MEPRSIYGRFRGVSGDEEKIFTFVASTDSPDRHGTVLNQSKWKLDNFRINPIIGYQHNLYGDMCNPPDPDDVVGKAKNAYVEDGKLMIDIVFDQENTKAKKIESKVERGFLNTVSVGFMELGEGAKGNEERGEDPELYYFDGQELLEVSIVNIPSQPEAAQRSFRSQTFDALKFVYQRLGGKYRFTDIENMRVRDIISMLEGKEPEQEPVEATTTAPTIRKINYEVKK